MSKIADISVGDTLPNGATVIDFAIVNGQGVVLAKVTGGQPYATWMYLPEDLSSTVWGHYFDDEVEAHRDFRNRISTAL